MRDKAALVEDYISRLPYEPKPTTREAVIAWFFNISNTGGLRLTHLGFQTLQHLQEPSWEIEVAEAKIFKNNRLLLALDKKLTGPYYINKKKLIMFNSREAFLASFYKDLQHFLENYEGWPLITDLL